MTKRDKKKKLRKMKGKTTRKQAAAPKKKHTKKPAPKRVTARPGPVLAHVASSQGDGDSREHDDTTTNGDSVEEQFFDESSDVEPSDPEDEPAASTSRDAQGMSEDDHLRYARIARRF